MDKNYFKQLYLDEINNDGYDRWKAIKSLGVKLNWLHKGWDSVVEKGVDYYFYNYERKHRSKEEYGDKLNDEQVSKYLALIELLDDFKDNVIKPSKPMWTY